MERFSLERAYRLRASTMTLFNAANKCIWLSKFVFSFSIIFALYHYITSGIGVPVDYWHMGAHMSGVLILIFISFPAFKRTQSSPLDAQPWWSFAGVPIYDWLLMIAGVQHRFMSALAGMGLSSIFWG